MAQLTGSIVEGLYKQIMDHAKSNYEQNGWDFFVECIDFNEFRLDHEGGQFTLDFDNAVRYYGTLCHALNERRKDIEAEAF